MTSALSIQLHGLVHILMDFMHSLPIIIVNFELQYLLDKTSSYIGRLNNYHNIASYGLICIAIYV